MKWVKWRSERIGWCSRCANANDSFAHSFINGFIKWEGKVENGWWHYILCKSKFPSVHFCPAFRLMVQTHTHKWGTKKKRIWVHAVVDQLIDEHLNGQHTHTHIYTDQSIFLTASSLSALAARQTFAVWKRIPKMEKVKWMETGKTGNW